MFKNKKQTTLICILAAVLIVAFAAVYLIFGAKPAAGAKHIDVEFIHSDGASRTVGVNTDEEYLGAALIYHGLISGRVEQYGLYILMADNETADESKQQWWCLTKAGGDVYTGADMTPIADGDKFELTLKTGW